MHIKMPKADHDILNRRDMIISALQDMLPAENIITAEDGMRPYETDALTSYKQMPLVVVLPETTEQVSGILKFCSEHKVKIIPRGAGTSLCGGALPTQDAVVIGLAKMSNMLEVDYKNRYARVQTGITNLAITHHIESDDFFYAPDPSSQLACTLAGNIAMNSGGAHCLKYGVTTNNLLGLKAVLIDGTIIDIGGPYMDSQGYDLLGLFTGSEGQLAIITEAIVRILPKPEGARPALFGFNSAEEAGACVADIIAHGIIPVAIEYMDKPAIQVCEDFAQAGYPMDVQALLIIEVEGSDFEIEKLLEKMVHIARKNGSTRFKQSNSEAESAAIWKGRKSAFGAMGRISDYYCIDGTIPTSQLPFVLKRIDEIVKSYDLSVANIFHAGDGNLHPLVMFDANDADSNLRAEKCSADILKLCVDVGGCLTGEHGVGIEKRDLMTYQFTIDDLNQQMGIKSALDPQWLLNPAKVFPLEIRPVLYN